MAVYALLRIAAMLAALFLFTCYIVQSPPYDDTDPLNGRSGLTVHTDCHTGVQYLSTGRGGVTPRISQDGKPIVANGGCK